MKHLAWFDGHLDLAYLAEHSRDLEKEAHNCGGGLQPASVTFPALKAGNVQGTFATIFVQRRDAENTGGWTYTNPTEAHAASLAQLALYEAWQKRGLLQLNGKAQTETLKAPLLLEGAAGVLSVEDFKQHFYDRGVRIVALTWAEGSPWSGGDRTGEDVTPEGLRFIAELDRLNCVHDLSHLSERAFWTVMAEAKGRKIASHSNCRALLPGKEHPERHLSDQQIAAIVAKGGIIGINLFSAFLVSGPNAPKRGGIADVLKHIQHMESVAGRRDFLALGSDFDGGFGRDRACEEVDGPEHLHRLAEALSAAGWTDTEIERFAWKNWNELAEELA